MNYFSFLLYQLPPKWWVINSCFSIDRLAQILSYLFPGRKGKRTLGGWCVAERADSNPTAPYYLC